MWQDVDDDDDEGKTIRLTVMEMDVAISAPVRKVFVPVKGKCKTKDGRKGSK